MPIWKPSLHRAELGLDILRPILAVTLILWLSQTGTPLENHQIFVLSVISANTLVGVLTVFRPSLWFLRATKFVGDILVLAPLLAFSGGISSPFIWLAPLILMSISLTLPWQAEAVFLPLLLASLAIGLMGSPGTLPTFDLVTVLLLAGGLALTATWARQLYEQERERSRRIADAQRELTKTREELLRTAASLQKLEVTTDIFKRVAESLLNLVPADSLSFYAADWKNLLLVPVYALGEHVEHVLEYSFSIDEGITGAVARSASAEIVDNTETDPRAVWIPGTSSDPEALLLVPLTDGDRTVAVLCLYRFGGETFREAELETARLFANQAEVALMNANLLRESRHRSRLLATLLELGRRITSSLEEEQICATVHQQTANMLDTSVFFIALFDEDRESVNYLLISDPSGVRKNIRHPLEKTIAQHAASSDSAIPLDRAAILEARNDIIGSGDAEAGIVVPVFVQDHVVGAIGALSRNPKAYDDDTARALEIIARQAGVALHNAHLFHEIHEAMAELEKTQDDLIEAEKMRVLGEMAHTISHEFNNLLATVLGRTDMLLRQETDPETRNQLERIKERAMHGAELVKKMRTASAFDASLEGRHFSPRATLERLAAAIVDSNGKLLWDVHSDIQTTPLSLPAKAVEQILEQLIGSVFSSMPAGGRLGFSPVEAEDDAFTFALVAEPSAAQRNIPATSPLSQAKNGMALGVRRARSMLNDLKGELRIERSSSGTVSFIITVPADEEVTQGNTRLRILIVDDEDTVRAVLVDMAHLLGHEADGVAGGSDALTSLGRTDYDLVISDIGMPEMDGTELVQRIRLKWSSLPIILVSGWGIEECEHIASEFQRIWILEKPVQIPVLEKTLSAISRELGSREA